MSKPSKFKINPAVKRQIAQAHRERWAALKAKASAAKTPAAKLEVLEGIDTDTQIMKALVKSSLAKSAKFNHKLHADRLEELNTQAQAARRVDVALGLYCFELKEIHLQQGQFGKWLAENLPQLAEQHSNSKLWQPSGSLETAMWMAKSALEVCGYKIGDYIELVQNQSPAVQGICDSGQLMLLPAAELPKEFKALRDQIFDLVDGKSQRQLRSEFKQIENGKVKHGRLKGTGGATKEQRAQAEELAETHRLMEVEEGMKEAIAWQLENADAKHAGMMDNALLIKLRDANQNMNGFITRVLESRKGTVQPPMDTDQH